MYAPLSSHDTSPALGLLGLPSWVEQAITKLYGATSADDFDSAFDAFVSTHATITVNGMHITRDAYKGMLVGELSTDLSDGIGGTVTFDSILSISAGEDGDTAETGTVNVVFDAEVFDAELLGRLSIGESKSNTISSSLNVVVTEDIPRAGQLDNSGAFDGRRATVLDQVLTEVPSKLVPPAAKGV